MFVYVKSDKRYVPPFPALLDGHPSYSLDGFLRVPSLARNRCKGCYFDSKDPELKSLCVEVGTE